MNTQMFDAIRRRGATGGSSISGGDNIISLSYNKNQPVGVHFTSAFNKSPYSLVGVGKSQGVENTAKSICGSLNPICKLQGKLRS